MVQPRLNRPTKLPALPEPLRNKIRKWEERWHVRVLDGEREARGEAALAHLFWKGCYPLTLLELLRLFCGVGLHVAAVRKNTKEFLKRTSRLAKRLKEDAAEVRSVDKVLLLGLDFPDEMDHLSEYLLGLYAEEMKLTVFARGANLQSELVDAARLIKMTTGRQHYADMADIVMAISGRTADAEELRKKVDNFNSFFGPRSEKEIQELADISRTQCDALHKKFRPPSTEPKVRHSK